MKFWLGWVNKMVKKLSDLIKKSHSIHNENLSLHDEIIQDEVFETNSIDKLIWLDPNQIKSDPNQPRKFFDQDELEELLTDIENNGQIQPIVVKEKDHKDGLYQIIVGERRWRAIALSKSKLKVAAIKYSKKNTPDNFKTKLIQMSENIKRSSMTIIDEAFGYLDIVNIGKELNLDITDIANNLSMSRTRLMKYLGIAKSSAVVNLIKVENITDDIESLYLLSTLEKENPGILDDRHIIEKLKDNSNPLRETIKKLKSDKLKSPKKIDKREIKKGKQIKITHFNLSKENDLVILNLNNFNFVMDVSELTQLKNRIKDFENK